MKIKILLRKNGGRQRLKKGLKEKAAGWKVTMLEEKTERRRVRPIVFPGLRRERKPGDARGPRNGPYNAPLNTP